MTPLMPASPRDSGQRSRWVGFTLSGQSFALPIGCVREVNPAASYVEVPGAPGLVLGVAALRGRLITVIDMHGRLQVERDARPGSAGLHCLIVVESGGEMMALCVDGISQLYSFESTQIKAPPAVNHPGTDEAVCGMVSAGAGMLSLLALEPLVDAVGTSCLH